MVGREAKNMAGQDIIDTKISEAIKKFVDKPFSLGDSSKGWDCLNSLAEFYTDMGVKFPRTFGDWNELNYPGRWKTRPDESRKVFIEFLESLGKAIDFQYAIRGDLIIFGGREIPSFPGIYIGNGHILMIFDKGGKVLPMRFMRKYIVSARRLINAV